MKIIYVLFASVLICISFISCQKQYSIDDLATNTPDTAHTIIDSTIKQGILKVTSNGIYKKDSLLGPNNTLTVSLKVGTPGTYKISTDTAGGFYFVTSVTYTDTGYKDLIVPGTGKPSQAGIVTFTLTFDTSRYSFVVPVQDTTASTVSIPPTGKIGYQQELFAVIGTLRDVMVYDQAGLIKEIHSQHYPDRKIFYNNDNTISKIEYWYLNGNGTGTYRNEVRGFEYDPDGNVARINLMDTLTNKPFVTEAEYEYNRDNTLKTKRLYLNGNPLKIFSYLYTNGNLTSQVDGTDTTTITYDTRTNDFKSIAPQFYFLDIQNVFDQSERSEIFYFSKNYPTKIGATVVSVSTTPGTSKPYEITFDNDLWYRYGYN